MGLLAVRLRAGRRVKRIRVVTDPVGAAEAAQLRYVSDDAPGIRRLRAVRGFRYVGPDGTPVRDLETRRRIRALAIPPAWTDVWICPTPRGHIQAVGRDAKGRKQYRYHARWREVRDATKYTRMVLFGEWLPRIRQRARQDLTRPGLPREKVLATIVGLLETTLIRVGNAEYVRSNRSFGLTTLRSQHVRVEGSTLRFEFRGKGGKRHVVDVADRRLAEGFTHRSSARGGNAPRLPPAATAQTGGNQLAGSRSMSSLRGATSPRTSARSVPRRVSRA
jgi:DNA topoisomerase-1